MSYMIGVDVGGTFTDFSVFNQETGELFNYKDSSTPADQRSYFAARPILRHAS